MTMHLVRSGDGPVFRCNQPEWMQRLLLRGRLFAKKVGREDESCIVFADRLREAALMGRLRAVFTHIPHEVGGGAKNAALRYSLAIALGLITGSADYVFLWKGGGCWIEFKAAKSEQFGKTKRGGVLTDKQKLFRAWCQHLDVPHHVVTGAVEGLEILRGYGVYDPERI